MGETPYEYSDRIKQYIYDNNNSFGDVTESFVLGKFSRYTNTEEERALLLGFLDFIDNKVRNHLGFWRYYYLKYLKGGFYNGEIWHNINLMLPLYYYFKLPVDFNNTIW